MINRWEGVVFNGMHGPCPCMHILSDILSGDSLSKIN